MEEPRPSFRSSLPTPTVSPTHRMPPFSVLFPASSNSLREPDPEFEREQFALDSLGIPWRVVGMDALIKGDLERAFRFFQSTENQPTIYRGWILHPSEYDLLSSTLAQRGYRLLISSTAYRSALLFPAFYPAIAGHSFPAAWISGAESRHALKAADHLGPPPWFIKDYAKSAKEIWPTGCVVRSRSGMAGAIRALKDYRGDRFESGIVIRPLLRLKDLGEHPFGGRVYEEYRLFFFLGTLISHSPYDRIVGNLTSFEDYTFLPSKIPSPFFSADIVVTEDDRRYILEIGDGGCSGLPPAVSPVDFYKAISSAMTARSNQVGL
jgi:hypothetical protein